ncbi:MAG TPA: hypothetical protein ENI58_09695 [Nitrospirae bacterium]|jgi:hypothetical protein|nr:hypothetical protein [Nitrospirota bacterium]
MKGRVLFVTKEDENFRDGFSYAMELSKIVKGGIYILLYHDKNILKRFEDDMAAAALAEAGEFETAKQIINEEDAFIKADASRKVALLGQECSDPEMLVDYRLATGDLISAIRGVMQDKASIEMVILSPSLMDNGKAISMKKLRKYITRPIVTMSRTAGAQ